MCAPNDLDSHAQVQYASSDRRSQDHGTAGAILAHIGSYPRDPIHQRDLHTHFSSMSEDKTVTVISQNPPIFPNVD